MRRQGFFSWADKSGLRKISTSRNGHFSLSLCFERVAMYHRNPLGLDVEFEERKKKPPSDLRTNNKRPNVIRNTIPIFPSRYVSRRIGVKRRRRRKIPPYVTNSDNENGTKRNKMKRNETISTTASRILYRRQPCNDQGERTYILMYRY